jgi:hypothetical protein
VEQSTAVSVRRDCRHYSTRSIPNGDQVQRCRVDANTEAPFACPDGCLFFESRSISDAGWQRFDGPEDDPGGRSSD